MLFTPWRYLASYPHDIPRRHTIICSICPMTLPSVIPSNVLSVPWCYQASSGHTLVCAIYSMTLPDVTTASYLHIYNLPHDVTWRLNLHPCYLPHDATWCHTCIRATCLMTLHGKNIGRHTAHTIVSWPNPKQWVIVHTSDLMMIIRQSIYILSIISKEMGKLKTHSPTYSIMDNRENMLNLTHTLDKLYLTSYKSNVFR